MQPKALRQTPMHGRSVAIRKIRLNNGYATCQTHARLGCQQVGAGSFLELQSNPSKPIGFAVLNQHLPNFAVCARGAVPMFIQLSWPLSRDDLPTQYLLGSELHALKNRPTSAQCPATTLAQVWRWSQAVHLSSNTRHASPAQANSDTGTGPFMSWGQVGHHTQAMQ